MMSTVFSSTYLLTLLLVIGTTKKTSCFGYQVNKGGSSYIKNDVYANDKTPLTLHSKLIKRKNPGPLDSTNKDDNNNVSNKSKTKKWFKEEYWYNEKIHVLGNIGFFGGLHAAMAPLATRVIDIAAYNGKNARNKIAEELHDIVIKKATTSNSKAPLRVIDLGCGVGESTRALEKAFDKNNVNYIVGVDTSPQMIAIGRVFSTIRRTIAPLRRSLSFSSRPLNSNGTAATTPTVAEYMRENAEGTNFPPRTFDLVTIMYVLHEAPFLGRYRILREARRLLSNGGTLAIVDISPDYKPSKSMLAGEPYVLEYKTNIQRQLRSLQGFTNIKYKELVPGHVGVWLLTRCKTTNKHINYLKKRGYEFFHLHSYIWNRTLSKQQ